jgi:uncharacterized protein with HEPN domain
MPNYPADIALEEIRENILRARDWIGDLDAAQLAGDTMRLYAVVRCLEIISEATRRLPAEVKDRHPHIEWQLATDAGNAYRHQYHDLQPAIIWATAMEGTAHRLARSRRSGA